MTMLVELRDIVELVDLYGCAAVKMNIDERYGYADYVFCFLREDGTYCANYVRDNQYGEESGELGAYAESGEIILQSYLRRLYLVPDEDYINSQIVIEKARGLPDAEYFDLLDAESMLALYETGVSAVIGQEY